jgi:hypothetical protein
LFKRFYINNVTSTLPIDEDSEYAGPQNHLFKTAEAGPHQPAIFLSDGTDLSFSKYANMVFKTKNYISIYHYYNKLLGPKGTLLFKFTQFYNPIFSFAKSYLTSSEMSLIASKESTCAFTLDMDGLAKDRLNPEEYVTFREEKDKILFGQIKSNLKKTGDRFTVDHSEYTSRERFSITDSRSLMYTQMGFLQHHGFTKDIQVFFGQFDNHGYYSFFDHPYPHAYALVIQVSKG